MLKFAKLKTFIFQCELEIKTKTFKAIDLEVKNNFDSMFDLQLRLYGGVWPQDRKIDPSAD